MEEKIVIVYTIKEPKILVNRSEIFATTSILCIIITGFMLGSGNVCLVRGISSNLFNLFRLLSLD